MSLSYRKSRIKKLSKSWNGSLVNSLMMKWRIPEDLYIQLQFAVGLYISKAMHQKWTAGYEIRVKNWAGVNKNMVRGMIGGRRILPSANAKPPYYRYNFFEKMQRTLWHAAQTNTVDRLSSGIGTWRSWISLDRSPDENPQLGFGVKGCG